MSPRPSCGGVSVNAQVATTSPLTMAGSTSRLLTVVAGAGQGEGDDIAREQGTGRGVAAERIGDEGQVGDPVAAHAPTTELRRHDE